MRRFSLLAVTLLLAACAMEPPLPTGPVDTATLGPLNGKEQALMVAAQGALASGDTSTAERDLQNAVAQSRGHVDAHVMLAQLYLSQDATENARLVLQRALVLQPNHAMANYQLGKLELAAGNAARAHAAFTNGLKAKPNDLDMLNGAGVAQDMLRQHSAAQVLYLKALSLHPQADVSMLRTNLAMSYMLSNQPKKAVDLLKEAAKNPDASIVTRHNLALAYGMLGNHAASKKLLGSEMTEEERRVALKRLAEYSAKKK